MKITISARALPVWSFRAEYDNFDDASRTLDGLSGDATPIAKYDVLTSLDERYSESVNGVSHLRAVAELGQQRATVERMIKPAHPFKIGDRVVGINSKRHGEITEPNTPGFMVLWDGHGMASPASADLLRHEECTEDKIEPGDRVRSIVTRLYGTVLKPHPRVTHEGAFNVRWDDGSVNRNVHRRQVMVVE